MTLINIKNMRNIRKCTYRRFFLFKFDPLFNCYVCINGCNNYYIVVPESLLMIYFMEDLSIGLLTISSGKFIKFK